MKFQHAHLLLILLTAKNVKHSFAYMNMQISYVGSNRFFSTSQNRRSFRAPNQFDDTGASRNNLRTLYSSSTTSNLFSSHERRDLKKRQRLLTSIQSSASPDNENKNTPILRKIYDATIGALWTLFVSTLPMKKLISIISQKKDHHDEDAVDVSSNDNEETAPNGSKEEYADKVETDEVETDEVETDEVEIDEVKIEAAEPVKATEPKKQKEDVHENKIASSNAASEGSNQIEEIENIQVIEREKENEADSIDEADGNPVVYENVLAVSGKDVVETETNTHSEIDTGNQSSAETVAISSKVSTDEVEESKTNIKVKPTGDRWAISDPSVDLTGRWKILVNENFKKEYDAYLKKLGQPSLVRSIAVSIVDMTTEEVIQSNDGRSLCIKGKNLRGIWDRTLLASGSDFDVDHTDFEEHTKVALVTADNEKVEAESWWENEGSVHSSWLRGVKKYGGGDFESQRYLDGDLLICDSKFHPRGSDKDKAIIRWTFERVE